MASQQHPPGLDLGALASWFAREVPPAGPRLTATLITGGMSNLTYLVTDGESEWILRRPPLGHVLATAHDMAREYRVITALRDTRVPVPVTYVLCEDASVLGAPFYVMERVAGRAYRRATELAQLGLERTRAVSTSLVDTLVTLHAVDPVDVGLGDFGRPDGYLTRQVRRWKKQLDASRTRDLPAADELHTLLAADVPVESSTGIVHGDYRLDNLLIDDAGVTTAVLDWEMATLGDPLTDLALMVVYHRLGDLLGNDFVTDVASAPGFLAEHEIVSRYAGSSERDLSGFGFYLGLAAYKLAAILEGMNRRQLHGQTVGTGVSHLGDAIHPMLEAGLTAVRENC